MQPEQVRYPTDVGQDAVPLLKRLVFPDKFRPAMQQVGSARPMTARPSVPLRHMQRCCPAMTSQ